ncbi:MAG: hypothetical protein KBD37_09215 [Burkholderiales bacterium]|nr:hypothetical protein [Burkholderiales bacterium]
MRSIKYGLLSVCAAYVFADGVENVAPPPSQVNWFTVPSVVTSTAVPLPSSKAVPTQVGDSYFRQTVLPESSALIPVKLEEIQVGSSFFESANAETVSIRQVGIAYEDRVNLSDFYLYFNQLLDNNLFYEVRGYMAYPYQTTNSGFPQIPASNEPNPLGYGTMGMLGYVIFLNSNVSLMPFLRVTYFDNFYLAYSNSDGSSIDTSQYIGQIGARISVKVNNAFALYASYSGGYQIVYLSGSGIYAASDDPQVAGLASTMEIGMPYKMTQSWSIIPSFMYNVTANNPNHAASIAPYNSITNTLTNVAFSLKLSYDF